MTIEERLKSVKLTPLRERRTRRDLMKQKIIGRFESTDRSKFFQGNETLKRKLT